ncbi:S41 family peptidase [Patescibacteria group bacterium]
MRIKLKTIRTVSISLILLLIGGGVGYFFGTRDVQFLKEEGSPAIRIVNQLELKPENVDFSMFWEVWDQLSRTYLDKDKLDSQQMVYGAIKGMTSSLGDPYTVFLPPTDNKKSKEDLNGEFGGVGIQLGYIDKTLAVIAPLEDTPAMKKGIKAGDLILHLKDEEKELDIDTDGMSLSEAVTNIRGKKGTPITLTLYRESKGTFDVEVVRGTITVPSVELKIGRWEGEEFVENADGSVAWLKVNRFGENTNTQWDDGVDDILRNRSQLDGVIVDFRNNPGGYVQSAIYIASEFIDEGVVVQQQGRFTTETYSVRRQGRLIDFPVVVLMNKGSASASEIVAGALRDRIDAELVGTRSFGKGTVQDAMDLRGNAGLHVTIARWLLPGGDWIHDEGIEPSVEVELEEPENEEDLIIDVQLQKAIETL